MSEVWQPAGRMPTGGTVFGVARAGDGDIWIATPAGLFRGSEDRWNPVPQAPPVAEVIAIRVADHVLLAGGIGTIVFSTDGGNRWHIGHTEMMSDAVTCLEPSPRFGRDGIVLAGTDGSGVLRSVDGGRSWRSASFGLQDFTIIALAAAPEWTTREIVFAATAHGLYRSPNGGRAWMRSDTGMPDTVVQALVVSPTFTRDRTVFAGTETHGLFRSTDAGKTWHSLWSGVGADEELSAINALWLHPAFDTTPIILVGTADGYIWRSNDGGVCWTCVASGLTSILCLAGTQTRLYTGLDDQGLLFSDDDGETWLQERCLQGRAITRLSAGNRDRLFAFGPHEGAWQWNQHGMMWDRLEGLQDYLPLLTLNAAPDLDESWLLAGAAGRFLRSPDTGRTWRVVHEEAEIVSIAFSARDNDEGQGRAWAGTWAGDLLATSDMGLTWTALQPPQPGCTIIALASWERPHSGDILVAATYTLTSKQIAVWRSADGGQTWDQWMLTAAASPVAYLSPAGRNTEAALLGVDQACWLLTQDGARRVIEMDSRITRLTWRPDLTGVVMLTPRHVLFSLDGLQWSRFDEGLAGQSLVDLVLAAPTTHVRYAFLFSKDGAFWRRRL